MTDRLTKEAVAALVADLRKPSYGMGVRDPDKYMAGISVAKAAEAADAIEALRSSLTAAERERDEERKWADQYVHEIQWTFTALGERFTLVPPDGGGVKLHEAAKAAIDALETAEARIAKLEAALTEISALSSDGNAIDRARAAPEEKP